ncbi:MAG: hypothetical protein NWF04_02475 [Candidatus Bathyarchaeota archaeon]|nr:hypothetical protein [Candidatus Bathyarchaeota archaeon]
MTNLDAEVLEGTTLCVYAYVVKEGKPVGPREVMRGVNLSSPSTAYRQLQKLESLGLLQKNAYGSYVVREKANVSGHLWIGRNLVPRLMCYSLFFFGMLAVEFAILLIQFFFQGRTPSLTVLYLVPVTAVAAGLFLTEGIILLRKNRHYNTLKDNLADDEKTVQPT